MAKKSRSSAKKPAGGKQPVSVQSSATMNATAFDPSTSDSALVDSDSSPSAKDSGAPTHVLYSEDMRPLGPVVTVPGTRSRCLNPARDLQQVEVRSVKKRGRHDLDAGSFAGKSADDDGCKDGTANTQSPGDEQPNQKRARRSTTADGDAASEPGSGDGKRPPTVRSLHDKLNTNTLPITVLFTDDEDVPVANNGQKIEVDGENDINMCDTGEDDPTVVDKRGNDASLLKGKQRDVSPSSMSASSDVVIDAMEVQSQMFDVARKRSLKDMAATNPGDGTKRLYGETTFIRDGDDLSDDLSEPLPSTPVKKRSSVGAELEQSLFKTPERKPKDVSNKPRTRSPLEVKECLVYMEDLEPRGLRHVGPCEVSDDANKSTIIQYDNLPPLKGGHHLLSWSGLQGPGQCNPDAWHEQVPGMSMSQFRNTIEFVSHAHIFNPSCIAPDAIRRNPTSGNAILTVAGQPNTPVIFATTVMITSSNIHLTKDVFGEQRRVCTGIAHNFEYQRMEALLVTALGEQSVNAQLAQNSITFSTSQTMSGSGSSPAKNPSKMFKQPAGAPMGGSVFAHPRPSLQGIQTVPLLDARRTRFNMRDNLTKLDTILPPFLQEVPEGSCAWIGYTVNKYSTAKGANINFNLMWAVILGTPD